MKFIARSLCTCESDVIVELWFSAHLRGRIFILGPQHWRPVFSDDCQRGEVAETGVMITAGGVPLSAADVVQCGFTCGMGSSGHVYSWARNKVTQPPSEREKVWEDYKSSVEKVDER